MEHKINQKVKNRTLSLVMDKYHEMNLYSGIAEIGYEDKHAISANWNNFTFKFGDWLERYFDCELLWDDEWTLCDCCYRAIRTKADSYGWEPSLILTSECETVCHECVADNIDDAIENYINNASATLPSWMFKYLDNLGFICYSPDEYCQKFETGFYPGQNDNPKDIAKDIEDNLPGYDYIFRINSCGQFDISWSVYIRRQS